MTPSRPMPPPQNAAAIARGVAAELGPLAHTQGVVAAGPLARLPSP